MITSLPFHQSVFSSNCQLIQVSFSVIQGTPLRLFHQNLFSSKSLLIQLPFSYRLSVFSSKCLFINMSFRRSVISSNIHYIQAHSIIVSSNSSFFSVTYWTPLCLFINISFHPSVFFIQVYSNASSFLLI